MRARRSPWPAQPSRQGHVGFDDPAAGGPVGVAPVLVQCRPWYANDHIERTSSHTIAMGVFLSGDDQGDSLFGLTRSSWSNRPEAFLGRTPTVPRPGRPSRWTRTLRGSDRRTRRPDPIARRPY